MALINCPNCNKKVSDGAKACPHCGFAVKKSLNQGKKINNFIDLNHLIDMAKEHWQPLVIAGVVIVLVIGVSSFASANKDYDNADYGDSNYSDRDSGKNKSGYPDIDRIYKDAEEKIKDDISEFSFNGKPFDIEYDKKNISDLKESFEYDSSIGFDFVYYVDGIVSLGIPYTIKYEVKGKRYTFMEISNESFMQGYHNIELASCDKIRTEDNKSILEYVKSEYKDEYDEIVEKGTEKNGSVCTATFNAKKNGTYITKDDTITVKASLSSTDEKKYKIETSINVNGNRKFNIVGKWHGDFVRKGMLQYPSTIDFEITEVNGIGLTYGDDGWIIEDDSPRKYYWKLVDEYGNIEKSRYGFYTFEVEYKYGKDASGTENIKTVRVYDDKLLFSCDPNTEDTDSCYELKRS